MVHCNVTRQERAGAAAFAAPIPELRAACRSLDFSNNQVVMISSSGAKGARLEAAVPPGTHNGGVVSAGKNSKVCRPNRARTYAKMLASGSGLSAGPRGLWPKLHPQGVDAAPKLQHQVINVLRFFVPVIPVVLCTYEEAHLRRRNGLGTRSGAGRTQSPARSAASSVFSGPATLPAPSSGSSSLSARLVGSNPSTETGEGTPTVRPPLAEPTEPTEPTELTERSPPRS